MYPAGAGVHVVWQDCSKYALRVDDQTCLLLAAHSYIHSYTPCMEDFILSSMAASEKFKST